MKGRYIFMWALSLVVAVIAQSSFDDYRAHRKVMVPFNDVYDYDARAYVNRPAPYLVGHSPNHEWVLLKKSEVVAEWSFPGTVWKYKNIATGRYDCEVVDLPEVHQLNAYCHGAGIGDFDTEKDAKIACETRADDPWPRW